MSNCACRESMNLIKRPSLIFKKRTWFSKWNRQYLWGDTVGFVMCYFFGHDPYVLEECDNEVACRRCNQFLENQMELLPSIIAALLGLVSVIYAHVLINDEGWWSWLFAWLAMLCIITMMLTSLQERQLAKLKPCPFCGEAEDIVLRKKTYKGEPSELEGEIYYYVECFPCDAMTGFKFDSDAEMFGFKTGKEMAIYAWNRRTKG